MIIAVTARGKTLEDQVDPRFGRCPYFLMVDTETLKVEPIENPNLALGGGAGIQSAQLMAEHDVKTVLTGNCGPNAYQTLAAADIKVIVGVSGTVREVVERFKTGTMDSTQGPNVASHFGTSPDMAGQSSAGMASGAGGGMGSGMGRGGMGGGRGMGRGMGRGQGAGMGGSPAPSANGDDEIDALKTEAQNLDAQLQAINARIGQIQGGTKRRHPVAAVRVDKCTGCGLCAQVCPEEAITIKSIAAIDVAKCTGCGKCVEQCPIDAISML